MLFAFVAGNAQVSTNGGSGLAATYPDLATAITALNAATISSPVVITLTVNETAPVGGYIITAQGTVVNSILIQPSTGAPITISGAITAGSPLIDLSGADYVTFDGLNSGGNSMILSNTTISATTGTSTIRFIGGATNNTITNCSILGSSTMDALTNGGNVFFSTDANTPNGNDNNTISNNNIGPVGVNLSTKGVYANGSTATTAVGNSNNSILNNNIFDYFGAAVTSSGISLQGGNNTWLIRNNRFYQTATRTWSTGAIHRGIDVNNTTATSGNQGHNIIDNVIGYASNTQTGTYTLTGSTGKFQGINYGGITTGALTNINNNTIAAVSLTGVTSNGTTTGTTPFSGIIVVNGLVTTNGNVIGSQSVNGSLTFSTNTTTATSVFGIYNFSVDNWICNGNSIGGITVTNAGASGTFIINALRANTGTGVNWAASQNVIGGQNPNSIQLNATGVGSQIIGFLSNNAISSLLLNNIRNLSTNIGTGTTTTASVIGICFTSTATTNNHNVSQNIIFNLNNSNTTAASVVTGIQFTGGALANVVERNLIYDLNVNTTSTAAEVNGIRVAGGTTTYRNNMIRLGSSILNAIGTGNTTGGVNGINEALGTNNFFNNSVYISGAPTVGVGPSFAFNGSQTVNTRSFRNNIFFNARSNSGATGKNFAVRVGGAAPNPSGLTINNNVYFANGTGAVFGLFNNLDVVNLAAWQTAVGQDAASIAANPLYVSATDLNLQTGSPAIDIAANLGIINDFAGDSRPGLNAFFDIGADEKDGIPQAINDFSANVFVNPTNGGTKGVNVAFAPQAIFSNNGIANQTNVTVRYRIVNSLLVEVYNQTFVIPSLNSESSTTVTFPNATLVSTGVYSIFAKAELSGDTVITNNEISGSLNVVGPDFQATSFVNPANGGSKAVNVPFGPQASFTNNGLGTETNITVRYRILDVTLTEVYNQTFVIPTLNALASTTVTFPNATLPLSGVYTIIAKAELIGDTVGSNDLISGTLNVSGPLAGTYTVGTAGNYLSLTNAAGIFDALNNLGASANITINIISDLTGETGAVALNQLPVGITTLIKPIGAARAITGSSAAGLIKINGADFVTINGSLGTTSRDLTITNTNIGTSSVVVWNASASTTNGATDNTFKNLIVLGQAPATTFAGILSGGGVTAGSVAESTNERITIQNNAVSKSFNGIVFAGAATGELGNVVTQNNLGSIVPTDYIGKLGMFFSNNNGLSVNKNTISNIVTASAFDPTGIQIGANVTNSIINANTIKNLTYTGTGGYGGHGIDVATGNPASNLTISNNMISELKGDSWSTFTSDAICGVRLLGAVAPATGGVKLYNNSINLGSGSFAGNASGTLSGCVYVDTAVTALDITNNIFASNLVNSAAAAAKTYAVYSNAPIAAFTAINYNDYATSGTQGVLGFIGSARVTLGDMITGFGGNSASINVVPVFTSATDLHTNDAALDNLGTPIAAVTTDIDGDVRSATPDMGADEFTFLKVNQFDVASGFNVYPNPVSDILNIEYTSDLTNVSVYNMLGQQVLNKKVSAANTNIDLSSLNSGTYLVKVEANNASKTIKVFKK